LRLLLDTHAFVWWADGDPALSAAARMAINDPGAEVFVSAASAWEITTKHRLGKWPRAARVAANVALAISDNGFDPLPVSGAHGQHAGALAGAHRDPFDRIIAAQALLEGLTLASMDSQFDAFGVNRLW
jgi:PIN domain nuclease of toxin-antitoxin system